jgi:hypothetical protein
MNSRRFMGSPPQAGSRTLPHRCTSTLLCSAARLLIKLVEMGHSRHFEREVGMTASPHERTYPAVIGSSGSCQNRP